MDNNIIHNKEKKRFELRVDGQTAILSYKPVNASVWSLTHTEVPNQLKGQGIGSRIVKHVLEYCYENNIQIIPKCPFIDTYVKRHPEWKEIIES